jgi:hypothetical protein
MIQSYVRCVQWRSQGFQSGVKGQGTGGVYPSRLGSRGCAHAKMFKLQMHAGEFLRIFKTLTPAFMPVNFGRVPNPFEF